jgi:hypothetical protein
LAVKVTAKNSKELLPSKKDETSGLPPESYPQSSSPSEATNNKSLAVQEPFQQSSATPQVYTWLFFNLF